MRSLSLLLTTLGTLGFSLPFALSVAPTGAVPSFAPAIPAPSTGPAVFQSGLERLGSMFSPEIQTTVAACWEQGKVQLRSTVRPEEWVICRDGSVVEGVTYGTYLSTLADVMAASTLVGLRTAMETDPRLTPQLLSTFVATDQGNQLLETIVQSAIVQSSLQPPNVPESSAILTEAVVDRLETNLQDPTRLNTLLGTPTQYSQTVNQFCTAPGMAVTDAQRQIGLDPIQLYAVCINESGTARDAIQQL